MPTVPPAETGRRPEKLQLSLICTTCGATYDASSGKNRGDNCSQTINFLTCSANPAHNTVFTNELDWRTGTICPENKYGGCDGTLRFQGTTGQCPGRLEFDFSSGQNSAPQT